MPKLTNKSFQPTRAFGAPMRAGRHGYYLVVVGALWAKSARATELCH
jgi:hypothetical protein